jgi:uncharacterized membrane protein YdbT with pleckstrin-like domain
MNKTNYSAAPQEEKSKVDKKYAPSFFNFMVGDNNIWFMVGFTPFFIACWRLAEMLGSGGQVVWPVYVIIVPIMILITLGMIVLRVLKFGNVAYEFSGHTIFISEGVLGWTRKMLSLHDVKKIQLNQSLVQGLLNAGTIRFYTDCKETDPWTGMEKNYEEWNSVSNPQQIVDMLIEAKAHQNA